MLVRKLLRRHWFGLKQLLSENAFIVGIVLHSSTDNSLSYTRVGMIHKCLCFMALSLFSLDEHDKPLFYFIFIFSHVYKSMT